MATLKFSRQRESIKEYLQHTAEHPTADMVYENIRKIYPNISLGTVYRNLALLADLGEARKVTGIDGADRYDGNTVPHNHFICTRCGSVIDLEMEDISSIQDHAARNFDGKIEGFSVNFFGVCGNCIKKS